MASVLQLYKKYNQRLQQGFDHTPLSELCNDLYHAMSLKQRGSLARYLERQKKGKEVIR